MFRGTYLVFICYNNEILTTFTHISSLVMYDIIYYDEMHPTQQGGGAPRTQLPVIECLIHLVCR